MNRKIKQYITGLAIACMMAVFLPVQSLTAYAASGRIAFSDKTASVGSEVDINMKITSSGGESLSNATLTLSYDPAALEFLSGTGASGGAGTIRITIGGDTADAKELVSTLKFKGLQAGTTKITVNGDTQEVYDSNNQLVTIDQMGSSAITLEALANASHEASLSDLKISPGTLTPEFSKDVLSYTASVDADVDKITVSAPAADQKASVVISGNEGLQPGENPVVCKIIAEDGKTVKEYTIAVTRAAQEGSGTAAAAGSIKVETPAMTVTIVPLDEGVKVPDGFTECTIKIDGQDAQGWVWATDTDYKYCIFYGMNQAGEKDFYRYDLKEKTMQRYFRDPVSESDVSLDKYTALATEHNSLLADYELRLYVIIGLAAVAALLLIIVIILAVKLRRHKGDDDDDYTNYDEKLKERRVPARRENREERYQRDLELEEAEAAGRAVQQRAGYQEPSGYREPEYEEDLGGQASHRISHQVSPAGGQPDFEDYPREHVQGSRRRGREEYSYENAAADARSGEPDDFDKIDDDFEFLDLDE